jgi:hypothetical protein
MKKARVIYRFTALVAVIALLSVQSLAWQGGKSEAFIGTQLRTQIDGDATRLIKQLPGYAGNWENFLGLADRLKKQASVSPAEQNKINRIAEDVRREGETLKGVLEGVINKVRGAGKFNEGLDGFVADKVSSFAPGFAGLLKREGGARTFLTETASLIGSRGGVIGNILKEVAAKVAVNNNAPSLQNRVALVGTNSSALSFAPASFNVATAEIGPATPAEPPALKISFKCAVLGARLITKTIKGTDSKDDVDGFSSSC